MRAVSRPPALLFCVLPWVLSASPVRAAAPAPASSPARAAAPAGLSAPGKPAPRPWLGLSIEKGTAGVRVREVMPDSPCASVDVHPGDEVLSLDEAHLVTPTELITAVQKAGAGTKVTLRLRSPQGQERRVQVVLAPRPDLGEWQRKGLLDKPAPDFTPKVLAGAPMESLAGLRGGVVLLDFFASWCGPCMRSIPALSGLAQRNADRGLRVIGVSAETPEEIGRVIREHRPAYTVAMDTDEQATRAYRIHAFPTFFLIDRKGIIRTVGSDLDEVGRALADALAEPEPARGAGR